METTTHNLYGGNVVIEHRKGAGKYQRYVITKCWDKTPEELTELNAEAYSVTAVTGLIDKSPQLLPWAERLTNEYIENWLNEAGENALKDIDDTFLKALIKEAAHQHAIVKEEAASVGKLVHDYAELFARAKVNNADIPDLPPDLPDGAVKGINAFVDWVSSHQVEFLEAERVVYSRNNNYYGKLDAIAIVDGKKRILDYKTSKGIYAEAIYQASGYEMAYIEETKDKITTPPLILHFDKLTGEFTPHPLTKSSSDIFLNLLQVKRDLKAREKELK